MFKPSGTILFICFVHLAGHLMAGEPEFRLVGDSARPTAVEVVGLTDNQVAPFASFAADDERWEKSLSLYVVGDDQTKQAIAGSYGVTGGSLRFTPRYALRPGMTYRAELRTAVAGGQQVALTRQFSLPAPPPAPLTRVVAIYPSAATLPENQLRFYLHFSAPMSAGEAYGHVKLFKADGTEVTRAFLEIGEELWDGSFQRLTLLFDPGRVKKGLSPREQFGPVLEAGQSYRLVIDKAWRDANGNAMAGGFEKQFRAGEPIETAVDARKWQIAPPVAASREALVIKFPRALDRALLMRMIGVVDSRGQRVEGEIKLGDEERRWEFRPRSAWQAGKHDLVLDTALEDNAGNNLARPFEVDVFDEVDKTSAPELMRIPFHIRSN